MKYLKDQQLNDYRVHKRNANLCTQFTSFEPFYKCKKINPTSALCTFLYWRSIAAYFSVKFRKYTAKNYCKKWKCLLPFKDTIFVHSFNLITTVHCGKFLVSRIVPSGWQRQNSGSLSIAVFEKLVKENQKLFYYSAYLPDFYHSPKQYIKPYTGMFFAILFCAAMISTALLFFPINNEKTYLSSGSQGT